MNRAGLTARKYVYISLPRETWWTLHQEAGERHITLTELVRDLIRQHLAAGVNPTKD